MLVGEARYDCTLSYFFSHMIFPQIILITNSGLRYSLLKQTLQVPASVHKPSFPITSPS